MRIEKDSLGELPVPDEAYYGVQTVRVSGNYLVSEHTYNEYPEVIRAMAEVKKACAITNAQIKALEQEKADAIVAACDEMIAGKFAGEFPVNIWRSQGTGVNMNVNEVLAHRANEILTGHREYDQIHPNSHVNMCQSSNDVFPTVENIVFYRKIEEIVENAKRFEQALAKKACEFKDTVRLGRTGLQDAVPNTWGQVFGGWQSMVYRNRVQLKNYQKVFQEVVLGATALGTGMGQQPGYAEHIYDNLSKVVGFPVRWVHMENETIFDSAVFDAMRNTDHQMMLMAYIKGIASALGRIGGDLMLFASGPNTGLRELKLPEVCLGNTGYQGESYAYLPRLMQEVSQQVIGAEQMATFAANEGELDHGSVNSGGVIAVIDALNLVNNTLKVVTKYGIDGIEVNEEVCRRNAELSTSLSVMVSSLFGYPTGVKIAKLANAKGIPCKEAALSENLLPEDVVQELFDVKKLTDRRATVEMFKKYGALRRIA